jgi:hypothetical protein
MLQHVSVCRRFEFEFRLVRRALLECRRPPPRPPLTDIEMKRSRDALGIVIGFMPREDILAVAHNGRVGHEAALAVRPREESIGISPAEVYALCSSRF